MGRALIQMITGIMFLSMNRLLEICFSIADVSSKESVGMGLTVNSMSDSITQMSHSIIGIIGSLGYVIGMACIVRAILEFKKFADEGGNVSYINDKSEETSIYNPQLDLMMKANNKSKEIFNFEDVELNTLFKNIEIKLLELLKIKDLTIENKTYMEKIKNNQLNKVFDTYISISKENRTIKNEQGKSGKEMVINQFKVIMDTLLKIEQSEIDLKITEQSANMRFLNEKFKEVGN